MHNDFDLENKHLKMVLKELLELKIEEDKNWISLPMKHKDNPFLLESLMRSSYNRLRQLEKAPQKPYFARIDFKEDGKRDYEKLYIGKAGFWDRNLNILITDWRAPVSSIYYDSNLGQVSYLAPQGNISGDLKLKRQIIIENGELISIFDVDSVSDDEILLPYLGSNADNRLKNIVASIQKEQNNIIREVIHKNLIIQGVAGSGKTTVALHRVAYLIYSYSKKYNPDQFMVIGPNRFFIKYISNVLPDLDVGNAVQNSFAELAINYISEKFQIKDISNDLADGLNINNNVLPSKYKLSLKYKEDIDRYFEDFQKQIIPSEGIVVNGVTILTNEQIMEVYNLTQNLKNISARLSMTVEKLMDIIERDERIIYENISKFFKELYDREHSKEGKKEIFDKEWEVKDELRQFFKKRLKRVLSVKSKKVISLYKDFITNISKYCDNKMAEPIKKLTIPLFAKKTFSNEDIPAMMYIKLKLEGEKEYNQFVHAIVDEAQDFGTFNFFILNKLLSKSTFSIFGDLAQGIYSYKGISNWDEVQREVFGGSCDLMELKKSYRTTIEIMLEANLISKFLNLSQANPVIRHGDKVKYSMIDTGNKTKYILEQIEKLKHDGMESIAIICKTSEESRELHGKLFSKNSEIKIVVEDNEDYQGGICVLTSNLAKGLEFDCVIISNAGEDCYSSKSELDMKLLYVSMTRALHKLEILYHSNLNKVLKK